MPAQDLILCPACGKPNAAGLKQCRECGASTQTNACPRCGHPNAVTAPICVRCHSDLRAKRCPRCQTPALPIAVACSHCGQSFLPHGSGNGSTPARAGASMRSAPWGWPAAIAYLIVVYLLCLPVFTNREAAPALAYVCATAGSFLVPVLLSIILWTVWAWREVKAGDYLGAIASSASLGIVAALLLCLVVPVVAAFLGGMLVLPVIIGAAEEVAKPLSLWWLLKRRDYLPERYGLLFGILAGLGFAATENLGYTFGAYAQHGTPELVQTIIIRMATSLAHAAWTGCLVAVLWRERRITVQFTMPVLLMFLGVTVLHALWDYPLLSNGPAETGAAFLMLSALCTTALFLIRTKIALTAK